MNDNTAESKVAIGLMGENVLNNTSTALQIPHLTPRYLLSLLSWANIDSSIYRINRVQNFSEVRKLAVSPNKKIELQDYYFLSDLLKSIPLFHNLSEELIKEVLNGLYQKSVEIGDVIVKQGEVANKFYLVTEGEFEVSVEEEGKKVSLKTLVAGEYFGEMALLEETTRQATITAATKGSIICLNKETFYKITANPKLKKELLLVLQERKSELNLSTQYGNISNAMSIENSHQATAPIFSNYEADSIAIDLNFIQAGIAIHTKNNDIYRAGSHKQLAEQLRVGIDNVHEKEEWELINNKKFGLLHNVTADMCLEAKSGLLALDDLDNLLALVWKKPSFFLAHPKAIAAFAKQCTSHDIVMPVVSILGSNFLTWRGLPLVPSDKINIVNDNGKLRTDILLLRTGEDNQGVVGLHRASLRENIYNIPSLSIQYIGSDEQAISNYLITKYFALAILVPDAIAVLKNVEIEQIN